MNIVVVGAGAVGGYFGGRLQEAGLNVTFLVREKRAEQLRRTGLAIESPLGNAHLAPRIAIMSDEVDDCDLVLLTVKNYHMGAVLPSIRSLVAKGAKILPLLNGVEHYDLLKGEFGEEAVLGGMCQIIATLDAEGQIVHSNRLHSVTFGSLVPEQTHFCESLTEAVRGANSKWHCSPDIWTAIWNKYAFITAFSGTTTASRLPIDEVMNCTATAEVFRQAVIEMADLSAAVGAPQAEGFAQNVLEQVRRLPAGSTSSMHQDFRKGLPLEVESLQGAAVRLAAKHDVPVPVISTLYGLIKPFEQQVAD